MQATSTAPKQKRKIKQAVYSKLGIHKEATTVEAHIAELMSKGNIKKSQNQTHGAAMHSSSQNQVTT